MPEIRMKAIFETQVQPPLLNDVQMGNMNDVAYDSNDAISENTDSLKANTALFDEFGQVTNTLIRNFNQMNELIAKNNQLTQGKNNLPGTAALLKQSGQRDHNAMMNFFKSGNTVITDVATGNYGGAIVDTTQKGANLLGKASDAAKLAELAPLASGLGIAGAAVGAGALALYGGNKLAEQYEKAMPEIFGLSKAFGVTDNNGAHNIYNQVTRQNTGTGLSNKDFSSVASSLAKNGVNDFMQAAGIAQNVSRWAYATGGDANQYANLAGIMSRYGKSQNVSEDFNYLVSAGKASGLNDSQIPEFLTGIEKVMEDGIAKGFTRSSTEVADTLLMFSKMSGGDAMWSGEQGAKRLSQMNSSIAGATGLNKTEDILVYRAFRNAFDDKTLSSKLGKNYVNGSSYVNTMQMIERGITEDTFNPLMEQLNLTYGDDVDAKIEALRKMTGLNYSGASSLLNLSSGDKDFTANLEKILTAPENQNNETKLLDIQNKIHKAVLDAGSKAEGVKLALLTPVANISDIMTQNWGKKKPNVDANGIPATVADITPNVVADWKTKQSEGKSYVKDSMGNYMIPDDTVDTAAFLKQFAPSLDPESDTFRTILLNKGFNDKLSKYARDSESEGVYTPQEMKDLTSSIEKLRMDISKGYITLVKSAG